MTLLFMNTAGCDGANLWWPFFWWLLGAFLIGLLLPWILKMFGGGGKVDTEWKSKFDALNTKYGSLNSEKMKLQKSYDGIKDGGEWKSKFDGLNTKFASLQSDYDGIKGGGEWKTKFDDLNGKYNGLLSDFDTYKKGGSEWKTKHDDLEKKYNSLLGDIDKYKSSNDEWKSKHDTIDTKYSGLFSSNTKLQEDYDACMRKNEELLSSMPYNGKVDDLTKIEGVGKKINELLNEGGIYTFEHLADAKVSYIQEILDAAGPAYKVHKPGTWPAQSQMAADGKWDELKVWQDELDGGV